jgi:radical SAM superfamily enzyme YgiQ (UPF0313 family)
VRILLLSTYDLGHQPFGLASPAAWLSRAGHRVVACDLAVDTLDEQAARDAELVAFYVPMHTATRLAARAVDRIRAVNPRAPIGFYGLYAAMNEPHLRKLGAAFVLGGEFEAGLLSVVERLERDGPTGPQAEPLISLERQRFLVPDRRGLPALARYSHLHEADGSVRNAGYTEASRGCKHLCRHCPIVPVYGGRFRVVDRDVVLADIRQQVAAGAEHVTFGDPDFWNGIGHAIPLVRALHAEFPRLTYDVTIKIEHLLRHREHLSTLAETGCRFVTSAVESLDDRVLAMLEKGHTRADVLAAVELTRAAGLELQPTFVAFGPWTTRESYSAMLETIATLGLVEHVAPIQLAIRLLVPAGSRLLEVPEVQARLRAFDEASLIHPWVHEDPDIDRLQTRIQGMVQDSVATRESRTEVFARVWEAAGGGPCEALSFRRAPVPFLTEPWYC